MTGLVGGVRVGRVGEEVPVMHREAVSGNDRVRGLRGRENPALKMRLCLQWAEGLRWGVFHTVLQPYSAWL